MNLLVSPISGLYNLQDISMVTNNTQTNRYQTSAVTLSELRLKTLGSIGIWDMADQTWKKIKVKAYLGVVHGTMEQ